METVLLTIIIITGIIVLIYILIYNNIQAYNIKINEAENVIDENLRKKYDLLDTIKTTILNNTKLPKKTFDIFEQIKNVNISSFDLERKLTEIESLINQIKNDYEKLNNDENFNNSYEDLYQVNEQLEAAKSYYNKNTTILNKTIKKFPSNLIALLHHIKTRKYFDGKDMFDNDINDFKL